MNGVEKPKVNDEAGVFDEQKGLSGSETEVQGRAADRARGERVLKTIGETETPEERALRFRRKLIKYFSIRENDIDLDPQQTDADPAKWSEMRQEIVENKQGEALASLDAEIDDKMIDRVLDDIAIGKIDDDDMQECLLRVRDPLHSIKIGSERMFEAIDEHPLQRQILALAAGGEPGDWKKVDEEMMRSLFDEPAKGTLDFRTPIDFEAFTRRLLRGVDKRGTEEQKQAYKEAANELGETLYGRRLEYYRQYQALKRQADERFGRKVDRRAAQIAANTSGEFGFVSIKEGLKEQEYKAKCNSLLKGVLIDGSPWAIDGHEQRLSVQDLEKAGLAPEFETRVGEREMYLSEIFQLNSGRPAVISYVPTEDDEVVVNSYYRDPGSGIWKMLPDYIRRPDSLRITKCGYGYGEASLVLPMELQRTLAQIEMKHGIRKIEEGVPDFLFAGMTQGYDSVQDYEEHLRNRKMHGQYYDDVESEPSNHDFRTISRAKEKRPPYTQSVNLQSAPDFDDLVMQYSTTTAFVGPTYVKGYKSNSGEYLYAFNRDSRGRAWIGQIENIKSPVTATGLRKEWVDGGDLTTGLYEPSQKAGKWGEPRDMQGPYLCMWQKYISQLPMVREFVTVQ